MPKWVCFEVLQVLVLQKSRVVFWVPAQSSPHLLLPQLIRFGTQEAANLRQSLPGPEEGLLLSLWVTHRRGQALTPITALAMAKSFSSSL